MNDIKGISRTWHNNFVDYTEMIVSANCYKGLYYDRGNDGRVKWVVAGKSEKGQLRRKWWDDKCQEHNIKIEAGCYAKIAVVIHPTKKHTCQICGKSLHVEYVYPNKHTIKALNKTFSIELEPYTLTIHEIVEEFGLSETELNSIKKIFKIDGVVVGKADLGSYIFNNCQTKLSPGVMSNSPDRYDGFHSDGNCCRGISDKGRHKENLQRYTQDRRVYENWADGNWKMADRLMAEFGRHGLSADHIGPISLGFCHRAKFQPMTKRENSAKNNRMSLSDIKTLLADEAKGEQVISWHSKHLWDKLKNKVTTNKEAVALSVLMRNNLHQILLTLSIISENGYNEFLIKLLNPDYSFYDYIFTEFDFKTGNYKKVKQKALTGKNQQNNVDRYIRVAFESLESYKGKKNRKQYAWNDNKVDKSIEITLKSLEQKDEKAALNQLEITFNMLAEIALRKW